MWGNGWEVPTRQWARLRDSSRTPAGFRPNGLPLGQQSRCRLGTFEPAQSKGGWTWTGLDARIRNGRTPAGCRPNGLPLGQQSRCRLGTFEPAQSKGGWMGLDAVAWVNFPSGGHASETAEPQQDSGPTGCHWVSRADAVWAPSNPLKAKVDGWGWTHASETAEPQQDAGPTGCHWVSRAGAVWAPWMDGAGRCGLGEFSIRWARIRNCRTPAGCHWVSRAGAVWAPSNAVAWVNFPSGGHASETAEPQQDSGPTGCHWVSRAAAVWAPSNPLKAKVDGWGWTLWPG